MRVLNWSKECHTMYGKWRLEGCTSKQSNCNRAPKYSLLKWETKSNREAVNIIKVLHQTVTLRKSVLGQISLVRRSQA
eukprot:1507240-Amphidinium_carterae.1